MTRIKSSDVLTGEPIRPNWLVPDILSRGSLITLAGDAGVGKSMLCYSLALALASGRPFLGRPLHPDRVVYFDEENSRPDSDAYHRRVWIGLGRPPIEQLDENLTLCHFALPAVAYAQRMTKIVASAKPALIVIDTANAACRIEDENDNAKANMAIEALRGVWKASQRPDCVMLILKHARLSHDHFGNEIRDIRGAKVWKSALDGLIIHTAAPGRPPIHGRYRKTYLWPGKSRAFGLTQVIEITPVVTDDDGVTFVGETPRKSPE